MKRKLKGLSQLHRKIYGEKVVEFANMALAALVIGQLLSDKIFVPELAILGFVVALMLYLLSYFLIKGVTTNT